MQLEERTFLHRIDWNFALTILSLNIVGLFNLYSATHGVAAVGVSRLFLSQIFWLGAGWVIYFVITLLDYNWFLRSAYVIYGINLGLLLVTRFIGKTVLGGTRWIDLGFFSYQPSETMKVALVLVLARVLARKSYPSGLGIKDILLPLAIVLAPFALTAAQPDLGSAMMLAIIGGSILLFIRIRTKILVTLFCLIMVAGVAGWFFALKDFQRHRVETFLNPDEDPRGKGYNSIQSKIAVGSGKILGKGFRKGTQSQLEFLPERHTDFIFSVLSEEHGFIGSVTTVAFFALLFTIGTRIASEARDKAGAVMVIGIVGILFWHVFINIGMVIGLLPIVGVPLPLLSYGGSSMLTTMVGLGLVSSVAYRKFLF
jgi:rod shape determining protein RodA